MLCFNKTSDDTFRVIYFPPIFFLFTSFDVLSVTVEPIVPKDLPTFNSALKKLCVLDPMLEVVVWDTGTTCISGQGEQHLQRALEMLNTMEAFTSSPMFPRLRETVTQKSPVILVKSPNRHNRLFGTAEPMEQEWLDMLQNGTVTKQWEQKNRIWTLAPKDAPTNAFVNDTRGCT